MKNNTLFLSRYLRVLFITLFNFYFSSFFVSTYLSCIFCFFLHHFSWNLTLLNYNFILLHFISNYYINISLVAYRLLIKQESSSRFMQFHTFWKKPRTQRTASPLPLLLSYAKLTKALVKWRL